MAIRDIEPLGALDRTTKVVETDTLNSRGVSSVRILSESKFFELVRDLVEEYLEESIESLAADSDASCASHDQRLSREYQRRWESLKTKQEIGVRQIERRMDRLSRMLRKLEETLKRVNESSRSSADPVDASAVADDGSPASAPSVDKKSLMREMLLGEDSAYSNALRRPGVSAT